MLDMTVFATFPVIETNRLLLRAMAPDDADAVFAIMADPRVMRYFGSPPMARREEALRRIQGIQEAFAERSGIRWAIARRVDRRFLGSAGFWRLLPEHARAEIGYELTPDVWGQGVMPEALAALLAFGFTRLGLHSVEAQIHPDNAASRRVLEKLGFVQEGYFRENFFDPIAACFTDTAVFSLLRARWAARDAR